MCNVLVFYLYTRGEKIVFLIKNFKGRKKCRVMPKEQGIPPQLSTPRLCILEPSASWAEPRVLPSTKAPSQNFILFYFWSFFFVVMSIQVYCEKKWEGKKKKFKWRDGTFWKNEMLACVTILVFQNTQRPFTRKIFIKIWHRV